MRSILRACGIAVVLLVFISACAVARDVHESKGIVTLENSRVKVAYDLTKGEYSLFDKRDKSGSIVGAHSEIDDLASNAPGLKRSWKDKSSSDDLGPAKTLIVTCVGSGQPNMILEFTLYRDQGFVVLAGGIENTSKDPVRVKDIRPMVGARAFGGYSSKSDVKMLNGTDGGADTRVSDGPNLESPNDLLLNFTSGTKKKSLVMGGLTYHDFAKYASARKSGDGNAFVLQVYASDPVGRLVEGGSQYVPDDKFYVDFTTDNPFDSLEQYGLSIRSAQKSLPMIFDFPEVDAGEAVLSAHGGVPGINTTTGTVKEMQSVRNIGFSKYSVAGVRLDPCVSPDENEQGWWDDAHFAKYGFYTAPYDTTAKWSKAVKELNGVTLLCIQPGRTSLDYAKANPSQILGSKAGGRALDYTSSDFRKRMEGIWEGLANAGLTGVVFENPQYGWHESGGFADKHATTASAYRSIFSTAKKFLDAECCVEEVNSGGPFLDVTLGAADCQAAFSKGDKSPDNAFNRAGLRWYKSKAVLTYDAGPLDLSKAVPHNADGRRRILTLAYLTCGRLVLAQSFSKLSPAEIHDLERIFPILPDDHGARPLDAFAGVAAPRVYDIGIDPSWHQVAFCNPDLANESRVGVDLSRDSAFGGMGLNPGKSYYVYDFWNNRLAGKLRGTGRLEQTLRPGEVRMMSVHEVVDHPQFISTNRHIMQGDADLFRTEWSSGKNELTGISQIVGRETYKVVIATNGYTPESAAASTASARIDMTDRDHGLAVLSIDRPENGMVAWTVKFAKRP